VGRRKAHGHSAISLGKYLWAKPRVWPGWAAAHCWGRQGFREQAPPGHLTTGNSTPSTSSLLLSLEDIS